MRKPALSLLALALGLSAVSGDASAGLKLVAPVGVSPTGAYGSVASARSSSDSTAYIGCYSSGFDGSWGTSYAVFCFARDAAGTTVGCHSYSDTISRAAQSITAFSYISFTMNATNGICNDLDVDNFSYFGPIQP
jgi:hypothetical protein